MSAFVSLGATSSVLTIITTAIDVWSSVRAAVQADLPGSDTFVDAMEQLQVLQTIWKACERDVMDMMTEESVQAAFNRCERDSDELRLLLEESFAKGTDAWHEKYLELVTHPNKGQRVETLVKKLGNDTQTLVNYRQIQSFTPTLRQRLERAISRMESAEKELRSDPIANTGPTFNDNKGPINFQQGERGQVLSFYNSSRQIVNNYGNDHHYYYGGSESSRVQILTASIRYPEMEARWNEIRTHEERTFEWIFHSTVNHTTDQLSAGEDKLSQEYHPQIADWFQNGNGVYVITGKPGSGKSTLMKFLSKNAEIRARLVSWSSPSRFAMLLHSFWAMSNEPLSKNFKGFLAHIATQMIENDAGLADLEEVKHSRKTSYKEWSIEELKKFVLRAIGSSDRRYCMLVDGLDEMEDSDVSEMLALIQEIVASSHTTCKICIATRPARYVSRLFTTNTMRLHDYTRDDFKVYVHRRLVEVLSRSDYDHDPHRDLKIHRLTETICSKAEGVWLWVEHVVFKIENAIELEHNIQKLQEKINHLPSKLSDLYRQSLTTSKQRWPDYNQERSLILNLSARLPLPMFELYLVRDADLRRQYLMSGTTMGDDYLTTIMGIFERWLHENTGCLVEVVSDERFATTNFPIYARKDINVGSLRQRAGMNSNTSEDDVALRDYWQTYPWRMKKVKLMHRTVHEFLLKEKEIDKSLSSTIKRISAESRLISYIEDIRAFHGASLRELCESLDGINEKDAYIVQVIDKVCQRIVESRAGANMAASQLWGSPLSEGRWVHLLHSSSHFCEYHDFAGLVFSCKSTSTAKYMLHWFGTKWSAYYKGYLALCALRAHDDDSLELETLQKMLALLQGFNPNLSANFASRSSTRTRPALFPDFYRTDSFISRLVTMYLVEVLNFMWYPDSTDEVHIIRGISWMTKFCAGHDLETCTTSFFVFKDEHHMMADLWWTPPRADVPFIGKTKDCEWARSGALVTFPIGYVCAILHKMLRRHGMDLLSGPIARSDFLQHCVMFPTRIYLTMLDRSSNGFFFIPCPENQQLKLKNAMFREDYGTYLDIGNRIAFDNQPETGIEVSPRLPSIDNIALDVPFDTPLIPLDPYAAMMNGQWKKVSSLREYYKNQSIAEPDASTEVDNSLSTNQEHSAMEPEAEAEAEPEPEPEPEPEGESEPTAVSEDNDDDNNKEDSENLHAQYWNHLML